MDAVIFDVDGTLCDVRTVRHWVSNGQRNFHRFHEESTGCPPIREVQGLWHSIRPGVARLVVTARSRRFERHTLWWLLLNGFHADGQWHREDWDQRPDFEVKRDILADIRGAGYNPVFAIDDNPSVLELWRQESIPFLKIPGWEC